MSKKAADPVIEEEPGLEVLFPQSPDAVPVAANVSMKLSTFWPDAAEVWFTQTATQVAIQNVTVSKTKFYHAVAVLPQEVASQILDLIQAPTAGDPYTVLRECLITLYRLNDYQQFEALVSLPFSEDLKPSHLMNRMLTLLPDDYKPDFILRGLLREKISDPRALALKADELYQSRVSPSSVNLLADGFGKSL